MRSTPSLYNNRIKINTEKKRSDDFPTVFSVKFHRMPAPLSFVTVNVFKYVMMV